MNKRSRSLAPLALAILSASISFAASRRTNFNESFDYSDLNVDDGSDTSDGAGGTEQVKTDSPEANANSNVDASVGSGQQMQAQSANTGEQQQAQASDTSQVGGTEIDASKVNTAIGDPSAERSPE